MDVIDEVEHRKAQDDQVHEGTEEEVKYFRWEVRCDERCVLPILLQTDREVRDRIVFQFEADSSVRLDSVRPAQWHELSVVLVRHRVVVQLQRQVRSKVLKRK